MTFLLEILRLGLHNLRLHKLRSFLTSLGIILGVDRLLDMTRTAVNVTGDLMCTAVVARSEGEEVLTRDP